MPIPVPQLDPPPIVRQLVPEKVKLPAESLDLTAPSVGNRPAGLAMPTPPEPSTLSFSRSAALLGSPIAIGHSTKKSGIGRVENLSTNRPNLATTATPPNQIFAQGENSPIKPPAAAPLRGGGTATTAKTTPFAGGIIELNADRQDYDANKQVVTAVGNVVMRFQNALLNADRMQINLQNRILVAEGNVALTRGAQVLRGQRFDYSFVQDKGSILNASGEAYFPRATEDFAPPLATDVGNGTLPQRPLSDRIAREQPVQQITNPDGFQIVVGGAANVQNFPQPLSGGAINRVRFVAERVDFDADGWYATKIRLTNDPFSPPELEMRADTARYRTISPEVSEITTSRSRLVFDQSLEIPIFQDRTVLDRRRREGGILTIGYDDSERGGLFVEQTFDVVNNPGVRFSLTPQYFVQKAVSGGIIGPSLFGLRANLDAVLGPRTTAVGSLVATTLDPTDLENKLRASLRVIQTIGTTIPHTLTMEYSYRDRLFNGSLGFQTVQSSLGAVLTSPVIRLGDSGIDLTYQAGLQLISADTDRANLLNPVRTNNRTDLVRYQTSASVSRPFVLWQGEALPATPTEGMRYTPVPVVPFVQVAVGVTGVFSGYSSSDVQSSLSGNVSLYGQFGNFSRPYLDYTGFNLTYSQTARSGSSPFLFDRLVDTKTLSGGITQQVYGPFRVGFQTSYNLDTGREISTDYIVEYSRRTYSVVLRFNPVVQIGSISFRINDFNWFGNPEPFEGAEVRPVIQGVTR